MDSSEIIYLSQVDIEKIENNFINATPVDKTYSEAQIDSYVEKNIFGELYNSENVRQKKSGVNAVDKQIPSKGKGINPGKIDVFVFNVLDTKKIEIAVEDKTVEDTAETALNDAKLYTRDNDIRVIIGFNGQSSLLRVKVVDSWEELFINGKKINGFIGPSILNLVYTHPNINVFELKSNINFTQKDFHAIIDKLRQIYRSIDELSAEKDHTRIDFTIAFIGLKMITEKDGIQYEGKKYLWKDLSVSNELLGAVRAIYENDDYKKYRDIFKIEDKNVQIFNFQKIVGSLESSILKEIHSEIDKIPSLHALPIDLFGEVYEVLASKKVKKELGEFFTRRHIIKPLLTLLMTESDIREIEERHDTSKPVKIVDPFCGTGGFLTEMYKLLCTKISDEIICKDIAKKSFYGYDHTASNATRTKINMYLAGDGISEVERRDSLIAKDGEKIHGLNVNGRKEMFDYVITNVPYGKGQTVVDKQITENKRMEINSLIKVVKILNSSGRALVIIPDGILESPSLANLREWFLKNVRLDFIVSLPKFAFAPYTKEKTYAVSFTKRIKPLDKLEGNQLFLNEKYWAYIVDNDGYANSDKRFETLLTDKDGKWLHNELLVWKDKKCQIHPSLIESKKDLEQPIDEEYYDEWGKIIAGKKYGYISMNDVMKEKYASYTKIKNFNKFLKDPKNISNLSDDNKELITGLNMKDIIQDGELLTEYESCLDELDIMYDPESKAFYNLKMPVFLYRLNIIPEKYFRAPMTKVYSLSDVNAKLDSIDSEVESILNEWRKTNENL